MVADLEVLASADAARLTLQTAPVTLPLAREAAPHTAADRRVEPGA